MDEKLALLGRWLLREAEAEATLLQLGLREEAARARQDRACLRGLSVLWGQRLPPAPPCKPGYREADARRLYGESLGLRRDYAAWSADEEYGCVFAALAEHKTRRCLALLQWLGKGPGSP